ncbi:MAG: sigma-54-dependent Fis family transcriptional regulator, partial [Gammaproteobacteria bacterium]
MDGIALVQALRAQGDQTPVIVVTAYGSVESAVTAMKSGACDYILRPFEVETVEMAVQRALALARVEQENRFLREELARDKDGLVGESPAMQALRELIARVAPTGSPVLICGETGTGKELVARAIHQGSGRDGLFVPVNCAALPAELLESELFGHVRGAFTGAHQARTGKFELADGGTLFLDEITEMPVALQAKLLRALQEGVIERLGSNQPREIDLRVVAATNRDPARAVADGVFRQDLLYRLDVLRIEVPPLRERREDIPSLARHFLARQAARMGVPVPELSPEVMERLRAYHWPGNVRELENVMERALVLSGGAGIGLQHLPAELSRPDVTPTPTQAPMPELAAGLDMKQATEALERRLIATALEQAGGNKSLAARLLNISERSLWYRLKKYDLH